jgi:hypothetical protein
VNRPCEVWALGKTQTRRLLDLLTHGHARHTCQRERPAFLEHDGDHHCRCGKRYAKQASDNH